MSFARGVKRNQAKKATKTPRTQHPMMPTLTPPPMMPSIDFNQIQSARDDGYAEGFRRGNRHGLESGAMYVLSCTYSALKNTSGIGEKRSEAIYNQIMDNFNTEESFEKFREEDQDLFKLRLIRKDVYKDLVEIRDMVMAINESHVQAGNKPLTIGDIKNMIKSLK